MNTNPALELVPESPLDRYADLERRIHVAEAEAIMARWEFGRLLLAEREANGGNQLPHGRLDEICAAVGKPRSAFEREAQWRIQFAERYETAEEARTAYGLFGSWTAVRDSLSARPSADPVPRGEALGRRMWGALGELAHADLTNADLWEICTAALRIVETIGPVQPTEAQLAELAGGGRPGSGPLRERYVVPPFTVLDAAHPEWQRRRELWLAFQERGAREP